MIPKSVIIWGGGMSIKEGLENGLKDKVKDKFIMGCNLAYKHISPTLTTFVDKPFFEARENELAKLPLVVGKKHSVIKIKNFPNFYLFKTVNKFWGKDSMKLNRMYSAFLVGLFSLTLAISLGVEEIYLLGFDWGDITGGKKDTKKRTYSHYYQGEEDCEHTGLGNTQSYHNRDPNSKFGCFLGVEDAEIINISLKSNIKDFKKISYKEFFDKLDVIPNINQEELRIELKKVLKQYAVIS
jgi:hypothetical protein